jgi:hypothetical protein
LEQLQPVPISYGDPVLLRVGGRGFVAGRALQPHGDNERVKVDLGEWEKKNHVYMYVPYEQLWSMHPGKLGEYMNNWNPLDWRGHCHSVAHKLIERELVPPGSKARYGFYRGTIEPGNGLFQPGLNRHGWIELDSGQVYDPTRWVFEAKDGWQNAKPFVWLSYEPKPRDYDQGMRAFKRQLRQEPPTFDPSKGGTQRLREMLAPKCYAFLCKLARSYDGIMDSDQLMWLANADPDDLEGYANEFYTALNALGCQPWVPVDYWDLIMDM